jgi:hypothetical protein
MNSNLVEMNLSLSEWQWIDTSFLLTWKALAQHMKQRGEQRHPDWIWELFISEPHDDVAYAEWCCGKPLNATVSIKVYKIYTNKRGNFGNHGMVIEIPRQFVLDFLGKSHSERLAIEDAVLDRAVDVDRLPITCYGGRYPVLVATCKEGE